MTTIGVIASAGGTANGPNAAAGKADPGAGAFAGMLVQVIGANSGSETTAGKAGIPVSLIGFPGQLGTEAADEGTTVEQLLAMLEGLLDRLRTMSDEPHADDQLPSALPIVAAALAQLVQQFASEGVSIKPGAGQQSLASSELGGTGAASASMTGRLVMSLTASLSAISEWLKTQPSQASSIAGLIEQAQSLLDGWEEGVKSKAVVDGESPQNGQAATGHASERSSDNGGSTDGKHQGNAGPVIATGERKAGNRSFREVLWHPGLQTTTEATASTAKTSESVSPLAEPAGGSPAGSGDTVATTPVWSLQLSNAAEARTAAATGSQVQLPALVPVQQFAEQMEKFLVKQFSLTQGNGLVEAKLTLHPEHLGQVDIKIVLQNGQLTAHFMTEHGAVRDLLENQMSQLRSALQAQGLQTERMEVVHQPSAATSSSLWQGQQERGAQDEAKQERNGGRSGTAAADDVFEAELERTSFLREYGAGSALNVTA